MLANIAVKGLDKLLTYKVPSTIQNLEIGSQVLVPLRGRNVTGFVLEINNQETKLDFEPKNIISSSPFFTDNQIKLFKWMSTYYGSPIIKALDNAAFSIKEPQYIEIISLSNKASSHDIDDLISKRSHKKRKIFDFIKHTGEVSKNTLKDKFNNPSNTLNQLKKSDLIKVEKRLVEHREEKAKTERKADIFPLNKIQLSVYSSVEPYIENSSFQPFLLYGITGSGKTEVYLKLIDKVLSKGQTALFLVPEISLTPQLCERLEKGLGTKLAVLHSQISLREKSDLWREIKSGAKKVVMGARSALFAPLSNLGIIIVDEEHDTSYKQSDNYRYHARDAAIVLAKISNCPIVLGSATPSFESIYNVQKNKYKILEIDQRANQNPLPDIEVVNLLDSKPKNRPSPNISKELQEEINKTLESQEQIIILYNKRGFSSYLFCKTCVEVVMCPHCSVSLTYHQSIDKLLCHYCDYQSSNTTTCPNCTSKKLNEIPKDQKDEFGLLHKYGAGTESIYEELSGLFPSANILRMDRDTITKRQGHAHVINMMRSGEADILVGTQMIAKGHDISNVTLVGIIDADIGLHLPDFRASEKTYQLIAQAGGRAGRGKKPGKVFIQTSNPANPTIRAAVENRFKAFVKYELKNREAFNYPPYCNLMRVIISDKNKLKANDIAYNLREFLKKATDNKVNQYQFFGPTSCIKHKINDLYRYNLVIKSKSHKNISEMARLSYFFKQNLGSKDSRITIDVDPQDML